MDNNNVLRGNGSEININWDLLRAFAYGGEVAVCTRLGIIALAERDRRVEQFAEQFRQFSLEFFLIWLVTYHAFASLDVDQWRVVWRIHQTHII